MKTKTPPAYQPKTGQPCHCKRGVQRDNCPACEGTGQRIDFAAIRARRTLPVHNDNCDGDHCQYDTGEVRSLPTGGESNAILCRVCFAHEITFRKERNAELGKDCQFELPAWDSLSVYEAS